MLKIHVLHALKDNFIYVLSDESRHCAVIDPGESPPVDEFLVHTGFSLDSILLTHHHGDHVEGSLELVRRTGCKVLASGYDIGRLPVSAQALREGSNYELFGETFEVLEVPGHTLGQVAYHFPRMKVLFPGDTLFSAGCGRLFEGTPEEMFASLQKIKALPMDTRIYFGHEYTLHNLDFVISHCANEAEAARRYRETCKALLNSGRSTTPTTLERELEINPFLRAKTVNEFAHWRRLRDDW